MPRSTPRLRAARWSLLLPFALLPSCATTSTPDPITQELAIETFETAWSKVGETYFDPTLNGVDWQGLHDELEPRVREVRTRAELRSILNDMFGRLEQSHFDVIPAELIPGKSRASDDAESRDMSGDFGMQVRLREGRVLVTSLRESGPAQRAGVQLGWTVLRLGDVDAQALATPFEESNEPAAKQGMFRTWAELSWECLGAVGTRATLVFLDREDQEITLKLERDDRDVILHDFGVLPTFYLHFDKQVHERDGLRIGEVHFTNWFLPLMQPIHSALEEMRDCDGVVLDLRGNTGGAGPMTMSVAGHFFHERVLLGTQTMRDGTMNYVSFPRQLDSAGKLIEPFAGSLAILIDETTVSASEIFAGGMQSTGRARIFGETSAGAVLPASFVTLPNGDAMLYAFGDFKTSTGVLLEGVGVVPDEPVVMSRAALCQGTDPQFDAAVRWISDMATSQ